MSEASHPLDRPLPLDVAAGESAFIHFYQEYAAFSWPWAWRRTVVFGSIGTLAGISFGVSHGLFVHSVREAVTVSLTCAMANVTLVGAGPAIGAFFRHRRWPRRIESALLVAAVLCGMFLAAQSADWADRYHLARMAAHGHHSASSGVVVTDVHSFVRRALDGGRDLLILFVASGGLALSAYFSERKRWAEHHRRADLEKLALQTGESDMKLTLLQAQVEPHFLFNTLASARSLVTSDPQRAAQTIDALAGYLRATLPKLRAETGVAQSTLDEQFAICAGYLELMKVRLADRLQVEIRLPPELREVAFPPLTLISLIENAIKHGAEPKPGATRVTLTARTFDDAGRKRLEVLVEDDGAGLKLGMGGGTGLANIRAQLLTRFGSEASLDLTERASGGVLARIVVPLEVPPPERQRA
jgi:hypothetical protein